ncbi:MAG: MarR family winged helix-turn-helix transcriptional regulator [Lautropia sp.]
MAIYDESPEPPRREDGERAAVPARRLDQSCLDHLLGYRITQANIPSRRTFQRHVGGPFKLSPVEFTILALLAHNDEVSPKLLAQALAVSAPAVTMLLDRLAERGLLIRVRSESDRRAQHVRLTRKGQQLERQAHARSLTMEEDLVRPLTRAERAILLELLRKVAGTPG